MARYKRCNWQGREKALLHNRLEAVEALAEERAKRTPEQQLALIAQRPGNSLKETSRLEKVIADRDAPKSRKKRQNRSKKYRNSL